MAVSVHTTITTWAIRSRTRWAEHVAHEEEKRNACRVLARKSEGKRPSGGVGIEVNLTAIRRKGKERTDHAQNRDK